jgi:hypothetical protein
MDDLSKFSDGYHTFEELYQHRNLLYLAFLFDRRKSSGYSSWRSRLHHDGTSYENWFIVGTEIKTETGFVPISYHLPDKMWETCNFLETLDKAPQWDGHTSFDVINRLSSFLKTVNNISSAPSHPKATPKHLRTKY